MLHTLSDSDLGIADSTGHSSGILQAIPRTAGLWYRLYEGENKTLGKVSQDNSAQCLVRFH